MSHSQPLENLSGQTKRAVGVAKEIMIGDLGPISGVLFYPPPPHIAFTGHLTLSIVVASVMS